jgi:lipopolysaccharide heptosyltransferase I
LSDASGKKLKLVARGEIAIIGGMPTKATPRILLCRLSALGDCIHTLPVLCALRQAMPEAHLAWLTQTSSAPLLAGHSALDELITVERGYLRSFAKVRELRDELRARKFDITIDPQSLTKSSVAAWLSGARQRIGFAGPVGRELAPWLNNVRVRATSAHAVDEHLELLAPLGIRSPEVRFDLPHNAGAMARMQEFLHANYIDEPLVIHPGAGWDSKLWPHLRYAEVAGALHERLGVRTVVAWSGKVLQRWANEIVARAGGSAIAAPETTLPQLVALLRCARLYLGSDSGPLHMAAAVDTPCVSLFGPSRPEHNGPYGTGHVVLQAYYQAGTTRERKAAVNEAMRAISSEMVIQACDGLLRQRQPLAA